MTCPSCGRALEIVVQNSELGAHGPVLCLCGVALQRVEGRMELAPAEQLPARMQLLAHVLRALGKGPGTDDR